VYRDLLNLQGGAALPLRAAPGLLNPCV
jgi:hypothetical protein